MPKVHFVKKARKTRRGTCVRKGDSFYFWYFKVNGKFGGKRYSLTPPTRSQLTQSEYKKKFYDLMDRMAAMKAKDYDTVSNAIGQASDWMDDWQNLIDDQESSLYNLENKSGLEATKEMLRARIDQCERIRDGLFHINSETIEEVIEAVHDLCNDEPE